MTKKWSDVAKNRAPTHPGEILLEEFLKPMELTQSALASALGIPIQRINTIIAGTRGVSAETAVLLARHFGTTPQFWMNLQTNWDLWHAVRADKAARAKTKASRR